MHDVVIADWIKPRTAYTRALLLTFRENNIPEYLEIPGEQSSTKVYEYISKPQICSRCLEFRHGAKYCRSPVQVCGKCDEVGHEKTNCRANTTKCHHCAERHYTGDKQCSVDKYEQEVLIIQAKQRVLRRQAVQYLEVNNPGIKMNYLRAATKPAKGETVERDETVKKQSQGRGRGTSGAEQPKIRGE